MVGDYPCYTDEVWDTERLWFSQHRSAIYLCEFQYRKIPLGLTLAHTRDWDGIRHVVLDSEYVFLGMHGAYLCSENVICWSESTATLSDNCRFNKQNRKNSLGAKKIRIS